MTGSAPTLILLNGAPGSGKSTLAQRYADEHPLVLALDIDVVRGLLGRWLDEPGEAGLLARRMAVEMARVHLKSGRDVVVPQFLGRIDFVLELERLCVEAGADFVEVALLLGSDEVVTRFARRSRHPETIAHRDAAALRERSGGIDALPELVERLAQVVASRPRTRTITIVDGEIDTAYRDLLAILDSA